MNTYLKIIAIVCTTFFISCGGGGDDDITPVAESPEAAVLVFPIKNAECNEGIVTSTTESKVTFEWNASKNTSKYTVVLKNLTTNSVTETNSIGTQATITLKRGTSYSWQVISKSNETTKTATSETWNFYNAGNPVTNYTPFPAEVVSPKIGSLTSTEVTLKWTGSDLDNDITEYDVYLDTKTLPTTLIKTTTQNSIADISLNINTVYYWYVVTKDAHGNNSQSPIFEFRTQ